MSESHNTISNDFVQMIYEMHENQIEEASAHLYNKFIGFISESDLPLPQIVIILQILLDEAINLAKEKYMRKI